jgi:Ca2+/Na+ antiporter
MAMSIENSAITICFIRLSKRLNIPEFPQKISLLRCFGSLILNSGLILARKVFGQDKIFVPIHW